VNSEQLFALWRHTSLEAAALPVRIETPQQRAAIRSALKVIDSKGLRNPISPLESTLARFRATLCISLKTRTFKLFRINTYAFLSAKSFGINTCTKTPGGVPPAGCGLYLEPAKRESNARRSSHAAHRNLAEIARHESSRFLLT